MPFSSKQMFDLVSDIESYSEFVPFCSAASIRSRRPTDEGELVTADLKFWVPGLSTISLLSLVLLAENKSYINIKNPGGAGPIRRMTSRWDFTEHDSRSAIIEYEFKVEVRFQLAERLVGKVVNERKVVEAFEQRAQEIYGSAGKIAKSS